MIVNPFINEYPTGDVIQFSLFFIDLNVYQAEKSIGFIEQHLEQNNIQLELFIQTYNALPHDQKNRDMSIDILTGLTLERTLGEAFLIHIYSTLESGLENLCNSYAKLLGKNVTYHYMKQDGKFRKMVEYMNKVIGFNHQELWYEINTWRKVRNLLVHSNGKCKGLKMQENLQKNLGLYIEKEDWQEEGEVIINLTNCKRFLKSVRTFLYFYTLEENRRNQ